MRLDGYDADDGLNAQLYYSLIQPSKYFYVEPSTGLVRTFSRELKPGNYTLNFRIEDRASRLFYHRRQKDPNSGGESLTFLRNRAQLNVEILAKKRTEPFANITIEIDDDDESANNVTHNGALTCPGKDAHKVEKMTIYLAHLIVFRPTWQKIRLTIS